MKRIFAAVVLVIVGVMVASAAFAIDAKRGATPDRSGGDASADHVLCVFTHPWPWGCGGGYHAAKMDDADGDGVADKNDKCPGTPHGASVDANGCPSDSDHDGVADGIDRCEGTPAGTQVDSDGCPQDSDRDGVFDGIDKCPGTPRDATVDASGCPSDADKDGVYDGIDRCPDTNVEWAVDDNGCPIPVSETYQQFLDAKSVSTPIEFESGKATIKPESEDTLRKVGDVLNDWPEAEVQIGGHTDSQGSDKFNKTLSENRAKAVKEWLTAHYSNIKSGNLSTKGFGESDPIASNETAEGRAQNRRVTFTLTNADELGKDIETRRYKKRGEK
jgi:OOP family OmpA-OmpF porin